MPCVHLIRLLLLPNRHSMTSKRPPIASATTTAAAAAPVAVAAVDAVAAPATGVTVTTRQSRNTTCAPRPLMKTWCAYRVASVHQISARSTFQLLHLFRSRCCNGSSQLQAPAGRTARSGEATELLGRSQHFLAGSSAARSPTLRMSR